MRDCIHERRRQVADHRAHQLRLQLARRAEMMEKVGVRHAEIVRHGLERDGVRSAPDQELACRSQRFAPGFIGRAAAPRLRTRLWFSQSMY